MKIGDIVTIKNTAGMLTIRIEKELNFRDVMRGIGEDKLPDIHRPRLEYHKSTGCGGQLITLCSEDYQLPFNMYLLHISDCEDKPRCYLGVCDNSEQDIFETIC